MESVSKPPVLKLGAEPFDLIGFEQRENAYTSATRVPGKCSAEVSCRCLLIAQIVCNCMLCPE